MIRRRFRPPIQRSGNGLTINLDTSERDLIARLLGEMRQLLVGEADQPVLRRLFPPAYHLADDAEAEAEYRRLMNEDLAASRLAAIDTVIRGLQAGALADEGESIAFLQSINALRLVLGTLLDVGEDDDPADITDDHPMAGEHHLYGFLSWLLDWSVRAMTDSGT
jgi:cytochrome P450